MSVGLLKFTFLRAQLSAQLATVVDFLVTILLASVFGVYYVYATLAGALCGGIFNCVMNYKWTFRPNGCKKKNIAFKYVIVWLGSIYLNTYGTYFLTEFLRSLTWVRETLVIYFNDYFLVCKVVVAIVVAFAWNYVMQRFFVFRTVDTKKVLYRHKRRKLKLKSIKQNDYEL